MRSLLRDRSMHGHAYGVPFVPKIVILQHLQMSSYIYKCEGAIYKCQPTFINVRRYL